MFGTLDTVPHDFTAAPDLGGPHGLLPPLQVETLAFTRPNEGGIQWQVATERLDAGHLDQLAASEHRPRIANASTPGVRGRLALGAGSPVALGYQMHITHEGGQLFDAGTGQRQPRGRDRA